MSKALSDEVHRERGRDVVSWRDISTAEPGPWILGRATHAILGGEKLLWGEAGLRGVSPEISKSTGQKLLCSRRAGLLPCPASDPLTLASFASFATGRPWGLKGLASENSRVWPRWVSCRIGGPHFQD